MLFRSTIIFSVLWNILGASVDNNAECVHKADLPPVKIGGRVIDILNGKHFDEIQNETPDEIRPPMVILFHDSQDKKCTHDTGIIDINFLSETLLPSREKLAIGSYDISANKMRTWYDFTPEMDLQKRLGVTKCPEIVFVPPTCDGNTVWCNSTTFKEDDIELTYVGCDDFQESCTGVERWSLGDYDMDPFEFVMSKLKSTPPVKLNPVFGSMKKQEEWLKKRDITTTDNQLRNLYFPLSIPKFTKRGFDVIETPKPFHDFLIEFYENEKKASKTEHWVNDATQLSFHESPTKFYDLDKVFDAKVEYGDRYIKPILEKWSGIELEQTSFYGIREYNNGILLKEHIDRIDTHVISATISLKKLDKAQSDAYPWPIQVIGWDGKHVRYEHNENTTVLYESARLAHGRPYPNYSGRHLGCFIHFKPKNDEDWNEQTKLARELKDKNTEWVEYKSKPVVEPETPIYSKPYAVETK